MTQNSDNFKDLEEFFTALGNLFEQNPDLHAKAKKETKRKITQTINRTNKTSLEPYLDYWLDKTLYGYKPDQFTTKADLTKNWEFQEDKLKDNITKMKKSQLTTFLKDFIKKIPQDFEFNTDFLEGKTDVKTASDEPEPGSEDVPERRGVPSRGDDSRRDVPERGGDSSRDRRERGGDSSRGRPRRDEDATYQHSQTFRDQGTQQQSNEKSVLNAMQQIRQKLSQSRITSNQQYQDPSNQMQSQTRSNQQIQEDTLDHSPLETTVDHSPLETTVDHSPLETTVDQAEQPKKDKKWWRSLSPEEREYYRQQGYYY